MLVLRSFASFNFPRIISLYFTFLVLCSPHPSFLISLFCLALIFALRRYIIHKLILHCFVSFNLSLFCFVLFCLIFELCFTFLIFLDSVLGFSLLCFFLECYVSIFLAPLASLRFAPFYFPLFRFAPSGVNPRLWRNPSRIDDGM